jgi:hypothetical protein
LGSDHLIANELGMTLQLMACRTWSDTAPVYRGSQTNKPIVLNSPFVQKRYGTEGAMDLRADR